jgi:carboxypeptidase D
MWLGRLFLLISFNVLIECRRRVDNLSSFNEFPFEDHSLENLTMTGRKLEKIKKSAHKVEKLPLFQGSHFPTNYAGHLYVDGDHSAHFYWLFEKPTQAETAPLIIWMNGGPGCSSMDGLFLELGPFKFENHKLVPNDHSWHKVGNLLFIDQPVGTGLSFTRKAKYPKNDLEVNIHFYKMLLEFFNLHDNYLFPEANGKKITRQIYLTGESHAGHYIPSMTKYILEQNENSNIHMNIAGLAIGNGWIDPYNQYDVSDFMHSLGIISLGQKFHLKQREKNCQGLIRKGTFRSNICLSLLDDVLASTGTSATGKLTMYDARLSQRAASYPPGHEEVESYLNKKEVRAALHVMAPQKYQECTDPPYFALAHQDAKGVTAELAYVLNLEIPVLLYSGQFDIICNHLGTEKMLNKLLWNGRADWLRSTTGVWAVDNNPSGFVRKAKNLIYLIVTNAGHMVPLSKPAESLDMIERFVNKKPFAVPSVKSAIASVMPPGEHLTNDEPPSFVPREGLRRNTKRHLSSGNQSIFEAELLVNLLSVMVPSDRIKWKQEQEQERSAQLDNQYSKYFLDLFQIEFRMILQNHFPSLQRIFVSHLSLLPGPPGNQTSVSCSIELKVVIRFFSNEELIQFKNMMTTKSFFQLANIDETFILSRIDPGTAVITVAE